LKGSGEFRTVYLLLEDDRVCLVFVVGPHENIDDKAERRVAALKRSGAF
jgi:mRNA-degrading endonuclease RelE of RelBE toxin-antitoxin system